MSLSSTTILVDPRIDNITTAGDVYNLAVCGTRKRGRFEHRSFLYIGIHNSEIAGLFHDDHFGDHAELALLAVSMAQHVPAAPHRSMSLSWEALPLHNERTCQVVKAYSRLHRQLGCSGGLGPSPAGQVLPLYGPQTGHTFSSPAVDQRVQTVGISSRFAGSMPVI